jgi:DUF1365 family protein
MSTTPHPPPKTPPSVPQSAITPTDTPAEQLRDARNWIIARMALAWLREHEADALDASPVDLMALIERVEQAHGILLPSAVIALLEHVILRPASE